MRHIFLTGFMGCGKTTLGRAAAASLSLPFVDLDSEIERSTGESISSLFAKGEQHFRAQESAICQSIVTNTSTPSVISLGGGTWIQPHVRDLIPADRVIFVDAPFSLLQSRLGDKARPLASDPLRFRHLYEQRLPLYRSAGHVLTVKPEETPEESARRLAHLIRESLME